MHNDTYYINAGFDAENIHIYEELGEGYDKVVFGMATSSFDTMGANGYGDSFDFSLTLGDAWIQIGHSVEQFVFTDRAFLTASSFCDWIIDTYFD